MTVTNRTQWLAIGFTMIFPTLLTWAYFVLLADQPAGMQQSAYAVGKVIQFAFPAVWVFLVMRSPWQGSWPRRTGMGLAIGFGLAVAVVMCAVYYGWLKHAPFFAGPGEIVRRKIAGLGLNSLGKYAAVGVFYALFHSLLEEYYWRWFVFGRLRPLVGNGSAIGISSVAFLAHHVILLATYFGWGSPISYLLSLCVGLGGAVWAWLYLRSESLYGPWISHCFVDAAIFLIGYDLARPLLTSG
jgi:membrane protease YdiL (CAAX protease family)